MGGRRRRRRRASGRPRRSYKLSFGVELEAVNRTRLEVARALNHEFGGYIQVWSDTEYDEEQVRDKIEEDKEEFLLHFSEKGRKFRFEIVEDETLKSAGGDLYRAEVVVGPLVERDLPTILRVCKTLLIAGCRTNETCGIHVHFSSDPFDGRSLRRLIGLVYMYEPILYRALQIPDARRDKFCKPIHEGFAREILASKDEPLSIMQKWYEYCGRGLTTGRFDPIRYYGLNLNPEPLVNHYELRYFNGTLEPDVVLSYAHLALGMLRYSLRKGPSPTLTEAMEFRQSILGDAGCHYREFNALLKSLGLGSAKFTRSRDLFLKNL